MESSHPGLTLKNGTMKKYLFITILIIAVQTTFAQTFEVRTVESDYGYVEVQIRETSGTNIPTTSSDITDLQFEIRWPQSYGSDVDVDIICADYNLVEGLGARQTEGPNYWRVFAADNIPFSPASNWVVNQWRSIGTFKVLVTSSSGSGTFELAPDAWVLQGLNFGVDGVDYTPLINSNYSGHPYPTLVYDYVWKGGTAPSSGYDENSWTSGANWEDPCGTGYNEGAPPTAANNCLVPTGASDWPTNFNNSTTGVCNALRLRPNSWLEIPNMVTLTVNGAILVENSADLEIKNGGTIISN
jgi:hypothetical protein